MKKSMLFLILLMVSLGFAETNITANIVGDSTWTVANSPYIIENSIRIDQNCSLTIEDDVIVKFNNGRTIEVRGTMVADGVTFTSNADNPNPGSWESIHVNSYYVGANLTMDNCIYEYARLLYLSGQATIRNTTLRHLSQYGIYHTAQNVIIEDCSIDLAGWSSYGYGIYATGDSLEVRRTTIQNSDIALEIDTANDIVLEDVQFNDSRWPVNIDNSSPRIETIGNNTFSNNEHNGVHVDLNNFSQSEWELPYFPIPYFFNREFTIHENKILTIASQNILKFNYALKVQGKLIAEANENEAIYFTSYKDDNLGGDTNSDSNSSTPNHQSWPGVLFYDSSDDTSIMRRCDLRYAGYNSSSYYKGAINTYNASPTIDNCSFSNNTFGVCLHNDSNPTISNNNIGASYLTPVAMSFDADPVFTDNVLSFSDNQYDAIGILPGDMVADGHIIQRDFTDIPNITYLLLGHTRVTVGNELTIDPGVVIKSLDCRLWVNGKLTVNGTADENVVFTSVKDDAFGNPLDTNKDGTVDSPVVGNWQGIIFTHTSSDESLINYTVVKYGDWDWYHYGDDSNNHWAGYGSIVAMGANPTISNSIIKDNQTGIACWDDANPTIINNQFFNSTWTPISMSCPADPTISGNTFTNVTNTALGILRGGVYTNGNIKSRDVAGYDNISYSMRDVVTINSGVEITADPGVVIKHFNNAKWIVNGGLKINGTTDNRVVFTSIKDDNVGNPSDTNGDGNATSASPDDWNWIEYNETSNDDFNTLTNFDVKFSENGLKYISASGSIDNATFTDNYYHGFWCDGNSAPTMSNSEFINNNESPIAMSLTADPTFNEITFSGNGTNGIRIIEGTLGIDAHLAKRSLAGFDNISYIINSDLTISTNANLTIEPGVVIKFDYAYHGFEVMVHGGLVAAGTPEEKIIFTDIRDDSVAGDTNNDGNNSSPDRGWWHGILFYDDSNDAVNKLANCEFKYGGNSYHWNDHLGENTRWGTVKIQSAYVDIDSCLVSHSQSAGISVFGSGNPDISNCEMYNISRTPIHMDMFANPTFENNIALNVGYLGIGLRQATIAQTATVPIRNFAGYENIPSIST
jgi:parallel beta-helix repeat protein